MKKLYIILIMLLPNAALYAQSSHVIYDDYGKPTSLRVFVNDSMYRFKINDSIKDQEFRINTGDKQLIFRLPPEQGEHQQPDILLTNALSVYEQGETPEGDMVHDIDFTPDGRLYGVLYQHSNNIYFYDSAYNLLQIVDVGKEPIDMVCSNNNAYVCCLKSHEIYTINLSNFAVTNILDVPECCCQVEFSPDETKIYVGFYSWLNGSVAAYNLATQQQLFSTEEPLIHHNGYQGDPGRMFFSYYRFELSHNGQNIIACSTSTGRPAVFNANTGELRKLLSNVGYRGTGFSTTGDTLYIFTSFGEGEVNLHRYQNNDLRLIDSIGINYGEITRLCDVIVNSDGSKAMTLDKDEASILYFNFNNSSCNIINVGGYSNDWILGSFDKRYALVKHPSYIKMYDIENGDLLGTSPHFGNNDPGLAVAISPADNEIICSNDLMDYKVISEDKNEYTYGISFIASGSISIDTTSLCGEQQEADVTNRSIISNEGDLLISSNELSEQVSIVNFTTGIADTLIFCKNVQQVFSVPGKRMAILTGNNMPYIRVLSLEPGYNTIANIPITGVRKCIVSPDGEYAYVYRYDFYSTPKYVLYKVSLENDFPIVGQLELLSCSCTMFFPGDYPRPETKISLSPDGSTILMADNPDSGNIIQVVDVDLMSVVASLPIPDQCVWDYAYSPDSKQALILSDSYAAQLVHLDGSASYIENAVDLPDQSFSTVYNQSTNKYNVLLLTKGIANIDPVTGISGITTPANSNTSFQIELDNNNIPIVGQVAGYHKLEISCILYKGGVYELPGVSNDFYFDKIHNLCIIPTLGPDAVSVFDPLYADIKEMPARIATLDLVPNPAQTYVVAEYKAGPQGQALILTTRDNTGREVFTCHLEKWQKKKTIPLNSLVPGFYTVVLSSEGRMLASEKLIVTR